MPQYTFELVRDFEAPVVVDIRSFPNSRAAWCHIEFLALRHRDEARARLQVKNSDGEIIILTGIATAVASAKRCSEAQCLVKRLLGDPPAGTNKAVP